MQDGTEGGRDVAAVDAGTVPLRARCTPLPGRTRQALRPHGRRRGGAEARLPPGSAPKRRLFGTLPPRRSTRGSGSR